MIGVCTGGGRPAKIPYSPQLPGDLRQHFVRVSQEVDRLVTAGQTTELPMPSIVAFAVQCGLHTSQIYRWSRKYPELADALNFCRQLQADLGRLASERAWKFVF